MLKIKVSYELSVKPAKLIMTLRKAAYCASINHRFWPPLIYEYFSLSVGGLTYRLAPAYAARRPGVDVPPFCLYRTPRWESWICPSPAGDR
jgi:hypothetical protein